MITIMITEVLKSAPILLELESPHYIYNIVGNPFQIFFFHLMNNKYTKSQSESTWIERAW